MALKNFRISHNGTFNRLGKVILTNKMYVLGVGTSFEQCISNSILKHKKH